MTTFAWWRAFWQRARAGMQRLTSATTTYSPRLRIGLAIDRDAVRAIAMRAGRVRWAGETSRVADAPIGETVVACLSPCPLMRRWTTRLLAPSVTAAIGPSQSQTKRLVGLPPIADPRQLDRLVREHAGRFFLTSGTPLLATGVRTTRAGDTWAAAFDATFVREIALACQRAGARLRTVVPSVDVVARGLVTRPGDAVHWRDGMTTVALTALNGTLATLRRVSGSGDRSDLTPVADLATVGPEAWRYADAFGAATAAVIGPTAALAHRVDEPTTDVLPTSSARRRSTIAVLAAAAAIVALLLPGVAAHRAERRATRRVAAIATRERDALGIAASLTQVTAALGEFAAFRSSGRSVTLLLRDLADVLPSGAAIVALSVDSLGGSIVALAPHAAALVTPLDQVAWLASPEIVGPVTREHAGGRDLERVTVRFRWARPAPARRAAT